MSKNKSVKTGDKIMDTETNQYGYVTKINQDNIEVDFCYPYPDNKARILFGKREEGTIFIKVEKGA